MMNTIRFARRSIARALCVAALAAAAPAAAIPDVVTWAARVENDAGAFDGSMTVTFELFDADTGGSALWTELVTSALVVDGDLVHELGSVEPLDDSLINRDNLFLQVTMNGDVLAPRTALRAVPYALRSAESAHAQEAAHAADATTLAGLSVASFQYSAGAGGGLKLTGTAFAINTSGVVTTMIADGAVTTAKIAAAAVTGAQLASNAVTSAKIGPQAIVLSHMSGRSAAVRERPAGCGGGLQRIGGVVDGVFQTTSCKTQVCGVTSGTARFFSCDATACTATTSTTCSTTFANNPLPIERDGTFGPVVGVLVFAPE